VQGNEISSQLGRNFLVLFWRAPYIFQTIPLRKEEAIYAGFVKIGKELIMPISRH
jgi:hypothetical protein